MNKLLSIISLTLLALSSLCAQTAGPIIDASDRQPIAQARIELRGNQVVVVLSDRDGRYTLPHMPEGIYTITITAPGYEAAQFPWHNSTTTITATPGLTALSRIHTNLEQTRQEMSELYIEDLDIESGADVQELSPLLAASRDPYTNTAGYTFSPLRFRVRGYDSPYQRQHLNGLQMNDMNNGYSAWSLWGGLNDAVRNQHTVLNTEPADFAFGDIGGTTNIDTRASNMRAGHRLSSSLSNRTYTTRLMYTYASGLLPTGWAFAFSGSRRWGSGDYSYVNGQSYDAWGYFASIEKQFGRMHSLSLTALAAPTTRGVASGTTQEAYDLAGSNYYNPNVGRQNGRWRNARIRRNHEPIITLSHIWQITDRAKLTSTMGYRFGYNAYSSLDWGNAPDPRPDYYRNLPSYYTYMSETPDQATADYYQMLWESDESVRYIDWGAMYQANSHNYQELRDAAGRLLAQGNRSEYAVVDRRTDQRQWNASMVLNATLSDHFRLDAGTNYRHNRTANFNVLRNLLGGDYWYDIDKFAERDFGDPVSAQMDIRKPNHIARQGDRVGYDYDAYTQALEGWAVLKGTFRRIDAYIGASAGMTLMYRQGNQQRGLFPDNSLGRSDVLQFLDYSAKAGLTYKLSGNHYFVAHTAIVQRAPYFRNVFVSPRTRNSYVKEAESEHIYTGDISYEVRMPWLRGRITGFYTMMKDGMRNMSFYDDFHRAFSNYVLTGIDSRNTGVEVGLEAKLSPTFTANGAFTYGHYIYDSNPEYVQTVDNSEKLLDKASVYWKGFNTSGGPQTAGSIGLTYYSPWYWTFGANVNYFGRSFIDMNPVLRTDKAREELPATFIQRETFADGITVDAYAGVSYRLMRSTFLRLNLSVSNLLNNKKLKSGGYEQLRVRYTKEGGSMMRPFDSKYFYAYGTTFFLNASLQF